MSHSKYISSPVAFLMLFRYILVLEEMHDMGGWKINGHFYNIWSVPLEWNKKILYKLLENFVHSVFLLHQVSNLIKVVCLFYFQL